MLTETVGRTHSGADFRECGRRAQHSRRFQELSFSGQQHPFGDGVAERTTAYAGGVWTLDATAGLFARRSLVIWPVDLEEIGDSRLGRALQQGGGGYVAPCEPW